MADQFVFIDDSPDKALVDIKPHYESVASRKLGDADPENLMLNELAYAMSLIRADINTAGNQNLVRYATGAALEELGYSFNIQRLDATGARCTLQYALQSGHPSVLIPAGNRVRSEDGKVIFQTLEDTTIDVGTDTVSIQAVCLQTGDAGNGYDIGKINSILDPVAYVNTASNTDIPSGGADEESDDQLRERIMLASNKFSCAGPKDAYIEFARSANPLIVDVKTGTPTPGTVAVYVLLKDGQIPSSSILTEVYDVLNEDKVRPLNDTVLVQAPTVVSYDIVAGLTLRKGAIADDELQGATDRMNEYKQERINTLGMDVIRRQIEGRLMQGNLYDVRLVSPTADILLTEDKYALCNSITITIDGTADE